jgi:hypothetical protein
VKLIMEVDWIADRATLRSLAREHPEWTQQDLAEAVGRSLSWVKKWLKRLREAPGDDLQVLLSRSRAHHTPYPQVHPRVIQRIEEIREHPPENLQRTPGPRAILYYLHRDQELQAQSLSLPRSTRTIWRILRQRGCILDTPDRHHRPQDRPLPMEEIQLDFKDATSVPPDPEGKQQHVVEICNFVDAGTSTWLMAEARSDFHAETALETVVHFLTRYGCPPRMTFDRDPRWVGSYGLRHFPSAFCRFLLCLGIQPNICPPRRPDKNAYVERLHRTLNQECLQVRLPSTLGEVREATKSFLWHYNHERPHQGTACGNRPPQVAFPSLPVLTPLPERVDPDRWLDAIHGRGFSRKVGTDGVVDVDDERYYIQQALAGQRVVLLVSAPDRSFAVWLEGRLIKSLPIKGLVGQEMTWQKYVAFMTEQARSEERRLLDRQHRLRQRSLDS